MKTEILRMENITKCCNGVKILDNFRLNVYKGEILGVVGLSGTGKTAIANILSGLESVDSGRIFFKEQLVSNSTKGISRHLKIFTVHHTVKLVPQLSIADNIFVIRKNSFKKIMVNQKAVNQQAKLLLEEVGLGIPCQAIAGELTLAQQHLVELAKAIAFSAELIILDDIAESYTLREFDKLKQTIKKMRDKGISFIFECHKPDELAGFADRITVLRDGKNVKTFFSDNYDKNIIRSILVGSEFKECFERQDTATEEVVFSAVDICTKKIDNISFCLHKGEILGILDLENKANIEVYNLMSGAVQPISGELYLDGTRIFINGINQAIKRGIGLVPENAIHSSLFQNMDYTENIFFLIMKKMSMPFMLLNKGLVDFIAEEYSKLLQIGEKERYESIQLFDLHTRYKIMFYRWILCKPKVLVCSNLSAMLDILTKEISYSLINEAAKNGTGVLLVTSDLSEAASICDRIIAISGNKMNGEYTRDSIQRISAEELY